MSTPALDRATEGTPPAIRRAINAAFRVYRTSDHDGHALNREVMTEAVSAALHDPERDVIARALARRWWDRNADDTDLWDDLTEAEQANVIANMNAADLADAVRAAILGEAS